MSPSRSRTFVALLLVAASALAIPGCGGGGGGGGGSGGGSTVSGLTFTVDKSSVSFDFDQNQVPPAQTVTITATGQYTGNLYIAATVTGPGLASSIPIVISGMTGTAQISVASGLAPGNYSGQLDLLACSDSACAHQLGNSPVVISYSVTVNGVLVRPADAAVDVGGETTTADLSGSTIINVSGGPALGWSASSSAPWLVLTNSSGLTGGSLNYSIDPSALGLLPNAMESSAQVTIVPTSGGSKASVSFNVNLNKNLPQITSVAPYVQLTGQTARVILRGSGFSTVASLAARLSMQDATISSLTLVNDTEVIAQFAPLTVGTHTVSVSNALGMQTATATVVAMDAPVYAYAAIPTQGSLRSLAYDPERGSVYAANTTAQEFMSFHYAGGAWTVTSAPAVGAYDVGLSVDGSTVVAVSGTPSGLGSTIQRLDPLTLMPVDSTTIMNGMVPGFDTLGFGIPTTNDGRTWLPTGDMSFVTPQSLTPTPFTPPPSSVRTDFYGGPWFAVSRDGERLIITQSASVSPAPPMLYMNAADSVIRQNPAGLTYSYFFSLSETGDRVLFDNTTLRDGSFNLVGAATIPTLAGQPSYYAVNGQVTPDGSRVYVLAYTNAIYNDPSLTPRVFVFDATTAQPNLTFLGYFDIPDYPGCAPYESNCVSNTVTGAISLDGRTLFFGGEHYLVVAPVPATLSTG
ncbi:MAG TPA: IPT/TIG domain-containing protein [Steroidobacteraceae bacterium]|nr:IPT/TIG domain-containing protein [Steroidobacteraceae bacterium]